MLFIGAQGEEHSCFTALVAKKKSGCIGYEDDAADGSQREYHVDLFSGIAAFRKGLLYQRAHQHHQIGCYEHHGETYAEQQLTVLILVLFSEFFPYLTEGHSDHHRS